MLNFIPLFVAVIRYGADTPVSFFDPNMTYGWNLQDLGDLLKRKDVPAIPGAKCVLSKNCERCATISAV